MGGVVSAVASVATAASGGGIGGILGSVVSNVLSNALAPSPPSPPTPAPLPAAPEAAPAPEAPTTVSEAGQEPVVDVEAAAVRARKRRSETGDRRRLLGLSGENDDSVILTKSLLGE